MEGSRQWVQHGEREVEFSLVGTPEEMKALSSGSLTVLLLRFVDLATIQRTLELLNSRPELHPAAVLIYRNPHESDFKMSCPSCGQKLWVRDADQGKKGQCPHCRKGFRLPSQEDHVQTLLGLSPDCHIQRVIRKDPESATSCLKLFVKTHHASRDSEGRLSSPSSNNATMWVDVDPKQL